jgi:hypothetical protein
MTIHLLANADFTVYQYSSVYIPGGQAVTLNGESITTVSDITLPIGVNSATGNSGTLYLIGKKKPESFKDVDGNYPFLGK